MAQTMTQMYAGPPKESPITYMHPQPAPAQQTFTSPPSGPAIAQHWVTPGREQPWSTGLFDCFADFRSCNSTSKNQFSSRVIGANTQSSQVLGASPSRVFSTAKLTRACERPHRLPSTYPSATPLFVASSQAPRLLACGTDFSVLGTCLLWWSILANASTK